MMKLLIVVLAVLAVVFAVEEANKDKRAVGYTGLGYPYSGVGVYPGYGYNGISAYSGYPGYGYNYGYNGVYNGALNTGYWGANRFY